MTGRFAGAIIMPAPGCDRALHMRECWNWQTGTFEVRVSLTYGFKSRFSHHTCGEQFAHRRFLFLSFSPAFRVEIFFVAQTYVGAKFALLWLIFLPWTRNKPYARSVVPPLCKRLRLLRLSACKRARDASAGCQLLAGAPAAQGIFFCSR